MKIIPALDIIAGKCVRLTQGDFDRRTNYDFTPLEYAMLIERRGASRLHLVDLDGARTGGPCNIDVLSKIRLHTNLTIDYGGGLRSVEDCARAIDSGADQITLGSIAVSDPESVKFLVGEYGPERFILGADVRGEKVATDGWQMQSAYHLYSLIERYIKIGITDVIITDIDRDGSLKGPAVSLYQKVCLAFPALRVIASGGVSNLTDLAALQSTGVYGAIIGKALLTNAIPLEKALELC